MTSGLLPPLLFLSASISLSLSFQIPYPAHALPGGYAPDKVSSWNTPFFFRHDLPSYDVSKSRDLTNDAELERIQRSQNSLLSLLLFPRMPDSVKAQLLEGDNFIRDSRGMKRKMFWSPLGYMPHRDISISDKTKGQGSSGQGANLLRYG